LREGEELSSRNNQDEARFLLAREVKRKPGPYKQNESLFTFALLDVKHPTMIRHTSCVIL
jgi:hypothetical protein